MDLDLILKGIRERQAAPGSHWGIGFASHYLKSIVHCLDGSGMCPTNVFGLKSVAEWEVALKAAESTLVYCDDLMSVEKHFDASAGIDLTEGSILDFDAIITSRRKDRDGDVMESKGADLDPSAPLLFNHVPMMPVGRVVKELNRSDERVMAKCALANVAIAGDMAALIALKALRISHGFRPTVFEPLPAAKGANVQPSGWHIKQFSIIEVSLVPVPANTDAVITAFSRAKLTTPFIKSWAQKYYDERPAQGIGFDPQKIESGGSGSSDPTKGACTCGAGEKEANSAGSGGASGTGGDGQPAGTKGVSNGSVIGGVGGTPAAKPASGKPMRVSMECPQCGMSYDLTTVPDGTDLSKLGCPLCANISMNPDGSIGDGGTTPAAGSVGSATTNSVRSLSGVVEKAGKVLSAANHSKIKEAHGLLKTVLEAATTNDLTNDMNDSIGGKNFQAIGVHAAAVTESPAKYLGGALEPFLRGSFEWLSDALEDTAIVYLRSKNIAFSHDTRADILGTYPDYAIVCVRDWQADVYPCYRISWAASDAGEPMWSGDPQKVEITAVVVEKSLAARGLAAAARKAIAEAISFSESTKAATKIEGELSAARDVLTSGLEVIGEERCERELAELVS